MILFVSYVNTDFVIYIKVQYIQYVFNVTNKTIWRQPIKQTTKTPFPLMGSSLLLT